MHVDPPRRPARATSVTGTSAGGASADPRRVLLITETFPFSQGREETFLDPEMRAVERLPALTDGRLEIIVAPLRNLGRRTGYLPAQVRVDERVATAGTRHLGRDLPRLARAVPLREVVARVWRRQSLRPLRPWLADYRRVALGVAAIAADTPLSLAYTYWFNGATSALLDGLGHPGWPSDVVTRAHGVDLYEERQWHPRRRYDVQHLSRMFPASRAGGDELRRIGAPQDRVDPRYLGVEPLPQLAVRGRDPDRLRIASCAYMDPVKRIPDVAEAVIALARLQAPSPVDWEHFGDGPDSSMVRAVVMQASVENLRVQLHGDTDNASVRRQLHAGGFAAFVNLSASEGGVPLGVVEAAEAGIPFVATAVGGNLELDAREAGEVVPVGAAPEAVAAVIASVAARAEVAGRAARLMFEERLDATRTQRQFWDDLVSLVGI